MNTDLILTSLTPESAILSAMWDSMNVSLGNNNSPVSGWKTSSAVYLPYNLSANPSITSFPSLISETTNPSSVPQSISLTITSCDTSTSLLVK